jgi:hypothetical protein
MDLTKNIVYTYSTNNNKFEFISEIYPNKNNKTLNIY